ncbi:MAG: glycerol-3-phosphate acyltransferase [Bacteroidetes bacterium]|nr:glycerol-3-phosphate acyltransferase [Bacteroidota bacterium]
MEFFQIVLFTIGAYLIGSIPTGIWIGKLFYGIDIRDHGSGTACHLNIEQIMGRNTGIIVRILDIIKGFLAAKLAFFIYLQSGIFAEWEYPIMQMSFGLAAVMGHIFPVFAGYRGGKGYHVSLGILAAISPVATAVFALCAMVVFFVFRYPYLGAVIGALALPFFIGFRPGIFGDKLIPMYVFTVLLSITLFLTHRLELREILYGRMPKVKRGPFGNWI